MAVNFRVVRGGGCLVRTGEGPLEAESRSWLTASKKTGTSSIITTIKWITPTANEVDRGPRAADEVVVLPDTLIPVRSWAEDPG